MSDVMYPLDNDPIDKPAPKPSPAPAAEPASAPEAQDEGEATAAAPAAPTPEAPGPTESEPVALGEALAAAPNAPPPGDCRGALEVEEPPRLSGEERAAATFRAAAARGAQPVTPPAPSSAMVADDTASDLEDSHIPFICRRRDGTPSLGGRIFDNMSFIGEVIIDWLELDKPRYYKELQAYRKQQRKEKKRRQRQEAAAIARIEEAESDAVSGGGGAVPS